MSKTYLFTGEESYLLHKELTKRQEGFEKKMDLTLSYVFPYEKTICVRSYKHSAEADYLAILNSSSFQVYHEKQHHPNEQQNLKKKSLNNETISILIIL